MKVVRGTLYKSWQTVGASSTCISRGSIPMERLSHTSVLSSCQMRINPSPTIPGCISCMDTWKISTGLLQQMTTHQLGPVQTFDTLDPPRLGESYSLDQHPEYRHRCCHLTVLGFAQSVESLTPHGGNHQDLPRTSVTILTPCESSSHMLTVRSGSSSSTTKSPVLLLQARFVPSCGPRPSVRIVLQIAWLPSSRTSGAFLKLTSGLVLS